MSEEPLLWSFSTSERVVGAWNSESDRQIMASQRDCGATASKIPSHAHLSERAP
jgi:hypothetical protein